MGDLDVLKTGKVPAEVAANAFAATLMAPSRAVLAVLDGKRGNKVGPEDIVALMGRFGLSYEASCWRACNAGAISAARARRLLEEPNVEFLVAQAGIDEEAGFPPAQSCRPASWPTWTSSGAITRSTSGATRRCFASTPSRLLSGAGNSTATSCPTSTRPRQRRCWTDERPAGSCRGGAGAHDAGDALLPGRDDLHHPRRHRAPGSVRGAVRRGDPPAARRLQRVARLDRDRRRGRRRPRAEDRRVRSGRHTVRCADAPPLRQRAAAQRGRGAPARRLQAQPRLAGDHRGQAGLGGGPRRTSGATTS